MAQKRNLISMSGTGRRASSSLRSDPGAARQAAALGQSDVSLGKGLTVDKHQRLAVKQARPVLDMADAVSLNDSNITPDITGTTSESLASLKEAILSVEAMLNANNTNLNDRGRLVGDTLNSLVSNLRESGILEQQA
jgi:hypothetical protein